MTASSRNKTTRAEFLEDRPHRVRWWFHAIEQLRGHAAALDRLCRHVAELTWERDQLRAQSDGRRKAHAHAEKENGE